MEPKASNPAGAEAHRPRIPKPTAKDSTPDDPDAMFKAGFLADVYEENPAINIVTRFPPEPNGFLRLGHSKAIAINLSFAQHHGRVCYLRYDDTNPAREETLPSWTLSSG